MENYCASRLVARRRPTREVMVGHVGIGGSNPIRVQSMTTTPTQDVAATVAQSLRLAEAGCEIVRITAQNVPAARALRDIADQLRRAKVQVPLVADIHFLPAAALEAAEHVEKVRVNPGNYADKKRFQVKEYSDAEYTAEVERLHEAFSPLVLKCKRLGRAMRVGTNHGSLSDRIMNRYGDTPLGMCESALEFLRIAECHNYRDIVISMKASNPKVMIQAYRLMAAKMAAEGFDYPLHLGVTEAGDGEDARIKSAIGIGSLLYDGLGDTIRVSLTEDPVHEIPVARDLAAKAHRLWEREAPAPPNFRESLDVYSYRRREVATLPLGLGKRVGGMEPPAVFQLAPEPAEGTPLAAQLRALHQRSGDARIEGLMLRLPHAEALRELPTLAEALKESVAALVLDMGELPPPELADIELPVAPRVIFGYKFSGTERLRAWLEFIRARGSVLALGITAEELATHAALLREPPAAPLIFTVTEPTPGIHPLGAARALAETLRRLDLRAPLWIRNTPANSLDAPDGFGPALLEASIYSGALLCDGLGDIVSVETLPGRDAQALGLAYNILQGARARSTKTEFVACPSCGRTLFDLESTTQRIRARTGHLKGVTIAIMGCIVNGPGEMADADFGYVGGAPGKVNLYVGKTPVKFNIPTTEAVDRLVDLIREHGKWVEPPEPVEVEA